jgi:hypothetical protein
VLPEAGRPNEGYLWEFTGFKVDRLLTESPELNSLQDQPFQGGKTINSKPEEVADSGL